MITLVKLLSSIERRFLLIGFEALDHDGTVLSPPVMNSVGLQRKASIRRPENHRF
jgi:hypothetical protein